MTNQRIGSGAPLSYLPGLDGLRALAVIAVLLYHADPRWMPGGYLGVEVFFVISGYLITALLLSEWQRQGRIDLLNFWLRRARRLLPALYLLLLATLAFAVVVLPDEVARLRSDALAAFGYVTNWYLVLGQQSYFETVGRPSLLQHLWSLAVEEQFYLLWPMLLGLGLLRLPRRLALLIVVAGAIASTLLMAALYQPGVDPSRIYYGTDTRAAGFLIGAALAFVWVPAPCNMFGARLNPLLLDMAGLIALAGLGLSFASLDAYQPLLYRGGFAAVAVATAVLIAAVVHPRSYLGAGLMEWWPLRWIGVRSYGIYLWHWPVFMVTRPQLDVALDGLPLLFLRFGITIVLADLSYRYVETPIRAGALGQVWQALHRKRRTRRWAFDAGWLGAVGTALAFCVMLGIDLAQARPPAQPTYLATEAVNTTDPTAVPTPTAVALRPVLAEKSPEPRPALRAAEPARAMMEGEPAEPTSTPTSTPTVTPTSIPTPTPTRTPLFVGDVTAIGDSVMLGAAGELSQVIGGLEIEAAQGLQVADAIDILRERRAAGQLDEVVIIHVGNNGPMLGEQFDEMMQVLSGVRKVVFINSKIPRPWEYLTNEVLAEGVRRYPNAVLVDWYGASAGRPECFWDDGIHLRPEGVAIYTDLIVAALKS